MNEYCMIETASDNKDEIKNMKFYRLNDTTYISRKVSGEEND